MKIFENCNKNQSSRLTDISKLYSNICLGNE